jgi:hypothetical protein
MQRRVASVKAAPLWQVAHLAAPSSRALPSTAATVPKSAAVEVHDYCLAGQPNVLTVSQI